MAATFEVWIPSLRTASSRLVDVAADVGAAGSSAAGAAGDAGGSCGGPLLSAALGRWSAAMTRCSQEASQATSGAGETMAANADRYEQDDAAASSSLDRAVRVDLW